MLSSIITEMSIEVNKQEYITNSPSETEDLARSIAKNLTGGEVIELVSDLGGGKTTFTRGLVRGLGSDDHVSSPTFTISNEYTGGRLRACHFDMYRLSDPGIIANELAEIVSDQNTVTVVEWADSVVHVLPAHKITVQISFVSDEQRKITIEHAKSMSYIVEGV